MLAPPDYISRIVMGIDLEMVIGVVVLTLLGVLLTGPGMWSEKWGWSALRKKKRRAPGSAPTETTRRGDAPGAPHRTRG